MDWRQRGSKPEEQPAVCACMLNPYSSIDPAPPHPSHETKSALELGRILQDGSLPLFERYRAMFSLRNKGGIDCVEQLCATLVDDQTSALLRHEVAYVLGQLQHESSIEALEIALRNHNEHDMVRHEAAEALGAIEGQRWDTVETILHEFSTDPNIVVRESCMVALDAADYWGNNNNNNNNKPNEQDDEDETTTAASFVQQKNHAEKPNRILINHFNVQQ